MSEKHIRKILHEGEWWFAVIDIVEVLTKSSIPKRYWSDLKRKLAKEGYIQLYEKIVQLKFVASDGKYYPTDCANTETMFRIIQVNQRGQAAFSRTKKNEGKGRRWEQALIV